MIFAAPITGLFCAAGFGGAALVLQAFIRGVLYAMNPEYRSAVHTIEALKDGENLNSGVPNDEAQADDAIFDADLAPSPPPDTNVAKANEDFLP